MNLNLSNPDFTNQTHDFNQLLEDVRALTEESERLRGQLAESQQQNARLLLAKEASEAKLQKRAATTAFVQSEISGEIYSG